MAIFPNSLGVQVSNVLKRFSINVSPDEAASLANFYWHKRPSNSARGMAEVMTRVPWLPWPPILNTTRSRVEVMTTLINRLDCQYWVDTFEHDRAGVTD